MTTLIHDLQAPKNGMPTYKGGDDAYSYEQVGQTELDNRMLLECAPRSFNVRLGRQ